MAESYTGGGPGGDSMQYAGGSLQQGVRRNAAISILDTKPALSKQKGVQYKAGAVSDKIYSISKDVSTTGAMPMPKILRITNDGGTPIVIMTGYETVTNLTTMKNDVQYIHSLVLPGENIILPVRAAISNHTDKHLLGGTAVDNSTPAAALHTDITTAKIDGSGLASGTTATTFDVDDNAGSPSAQVGWFRIGDKIRIDDEIMEVTAIADNTGTEAQLTVIRGVDGSTAATHSDNTAIAFAFHNSYQKFDKYSSAQTDSLGKYKNTNMFALGRTNGFVVDGGDSSVTGLSGITPGSFSLKFYTEGGYTSLGMSGINSGTLTGLVVSTEYKFNITVDDGSVYENLSITTDATNQRFGGKNGLIEKLQDALDTQFRTAGSNLFERKVNVSIVEGDLRFSSGTNKSTSAILLAAPTSGTTIFGVGRIPAVGNVVKVDARLPDDVVYDRITYATNPNTKAFAYDNGAGEIFGAARGSINYETGAIDFTGPKDADFVFSVLHSGVFSGKLDSEDTHKNALVDVYANTTSQKWNGSVLVEAW
tara:strand:+ start:4684 stop:6291 length:1608 start_codon:yes stop_codon:yes gene_type:complete